MIDPNAEPIDPFYRILHLSGGKRLMIILDLDAPDPRRHLANIGKLFFWHDGYELGDGRPQKDINAFAATQYAVKIPVFVSTSAGKGISITLDPSSRPEAALAGFVVMSDQNLSSAFSGMSGQEARELAFEVLSEEVRVYAAYLAGDTYSYILYDEMGDEIDSCHGFYGEDLLTNGMIEMLDRDVGAEVVTILIDEAARASKSSETPLLTAGLK